MANEVKEKLPFPITKPNPDQYAVDAEDVGYGNGSVKDVIGNTLIPIDFTEGSYIYKSVRLGATINTIDVTDLRSASSFCYAIIPCNKGDVFDVTVDCNTNNSFPWAFTDSAYYVLGIGTNDIKTKQLLIAPSDGYLLLNSLKDSNHSCYKGTNVVRNAELIGKNSKDNRTLAEKAINTFNKRYVDALGDVSFTDNIRLWKDGTTVASSSGYVSDAILIDKSCEYYLTTRLDIYRIGVAYYEDSACTRVVGFGMLSDTTADYTRVLLSIPPMANYMRVCSMTTLSLEKVEYYIGGTDIEELERIVENIQEQVTDLPTVANAVAYHYSTDIYLKSPFISVSANNWSSESSRWSYSNNRYECAAGSDMGALVFNQLPTSGLSYIIQITQDTGVIEDAFDVYCGDVKIDPYNGNRNMTIGFHSDGGSIKIKPKSTRAFSIARFDVSEITTEEQSVSSITFVLENVHNGNSASSNIDGKWNVAIGPTARTFAHNINASRSVGIGFRALEFLEGGIQNVAIGTFALQRRTYAERVIAIGADTAYGDRINTINDTIIIGKGGLACDQSGSPVDIDKTIVIGTAAMLNPTSSVTSTIAIGYSSAQKGGSYNVCIGELSGRDGGDRNTSVGYQAGRNGGNKNVAIGYQAGVLNTGDKNVAIGNEAYRGSYAKGLGNVFIGNMADFSHSLSGVTANNVVAIGNEVRAYGTNDIVIGYGAVANKANQMVLGNSAIEEVIIAGKKISFNIDGSVTWQDITSGNE